MVLQPNRVIVPCVSKERRNCIDKYDWNSVRCGLELQNKIRTFIKITICYYWKLNKISIPKYLIHHFLKQAFLFPFNPSFAITKE